MTLFENENWLVLDKPPGISSHGANVGDRGVTELLELHYGTTVHLVSRLDKETSGILICAKNPQSSAVAQEHHEGEVSSKTYLLVCESPSSAQDHNFVVDEPIDGRPARTEFKFIERWGNDLAFFHATIRSGKKHQIRRHSAHVDLPIVGDSTYGQARGERLYLHCAHLEWPGLPPIESPMPESFRALRHSLRSQAPADSYFTDNLDISLAAALERRGSLLQDTVGARRAIHRFECGADFAIDLFGLNFCAWLYDEQAGAALSHCLEQLTKRLGLSGGVIKSSLKNPHNKGKLCETTIVEKPQDNPLVIQEGGLRFIVNLLENEQTGFFADQRDNRKKVINTAPGKDVANLFSYTCSFSVAARSGGCSSIISVDNSHSALGQGMRNFELNGLEGKQGTRFAKDDVRSWLRRQERKGAKYDLIICDPPTFGSASKGQSPFRLAVEWPHLAKSISKILQPAGEALFCTNSRSLETAWLEDTLRQHFRIVDRHRTPLDFPESVDERHNRFFWCQL